MIWHIRERAKNPLEKAGSHRSSKLFLTMFFSVIFSGLYLILSKDIKEYYRIAVVDK